MWTQAVKCQCMLDGCTLLTSPLHRSWLLTWHKMRGLIAMVTHAHTFHAICSLCWSRRSRHESRSCSEMFIFMSVNVVFLCLHSRRSEFNFLGKQTKHDFVGRFLRYRVNAKKEEASQAKSESSHCWIVKVELLKVWKQHTRTKSQTSLWIILIAKKNTQATKTTHLSNNQCK